jgi:hypothetical protein
LEFQSLRTTQWSAEQLFAAIWTNRGRVQTFDEIRLFLMDQPNNGSVAAEIAGNAYRPHWLTFARPLA